MRKGTGVFPGLRAASRVPELLAMFHATLLPPEKALSRVAGSFSKKLGAAQFW